MIENLIRFNVELATLEWRGRYDIMEKVIRLVIALVYHSYSTVDDYLKYETKVNVERILENSLYLPAITICNHNPLRLSKIGLLSNERQEIIERVRNRSDTLVNTPGEPNVEEDISKLVNNFYDSLESVIYEVAFKDRDSFQKAGHQIEDMLLWCTVGENHAVCSNLSKKRIYSQDYNNCFTLDTSKFEQSKSGTYNGLELAFYLEPEEYVPWITDTKGIQLLVHPKRYYGYPAYDGIALSPGMMTLVAITQENVVRLGEPYRSCVETDEYIDKYNFSYNLLLCNDICWLKQYIMNCGCYDSFMFNVMDNPNNVTICDEKYSCVTQEKLYDPGLCNCKVPCREVDYKTKVTSAQWPNEQKGTNFSSEICEKLRHQTERELRDNFVGVRIYYESMYSTQLTDVAEVNLAAFLSNLGGCVGLWIGVSVLSIVELLHLFADIIWKILSGIKLCNRSIGLLSNELQQILDDARDIMNKAGHQLEDMLLWFKFRDSKITEKSAKLFYSDDYNNCYTLDTADFKQMFNGVNQGIELFMYLEPDEYIPEITDTKGIQLVVHPANAYLYPADDGIALSPGMMTLVALTLENITRLGQPYSSCVENDEYIDKYNYTYTVDLCEAMCVPNQYLAVCGCNASSWEDVDYLNNASFCGLNNSCEFEFDNALCSCENPCREIVYKTRVDSTPWPTYTTLKLLVNQLCLKNDFPRDTCTKLRNQRETELRDNFVGVRIFYESMFVTYFNDEAEINLAAFLSNLGGCVGLWIGISVFSVFELLYLLTNMFWTTLPTAKL
ncbi:hypothetical protein Btru_057410 [Bulinus truncatus]|nr:hypothetical protein Btru_057410 [Bulinus truncatus]